MKPDHRTKDEIIYGIHPVTEALKAGRRKVSRVYISRENPGKRVNKLAEKIRKTDIYVEAVSREQLNKLSRSDYHQDIAARVSLLPTTAGSRLLEPESGIGPDTFLLVLDSVVDPQNFGALVRTAVCMGADAVIISRDRSAGPGPAASRASAGAMEHARICVVTNLANYMKDLKKNGFWIIGLDHMAHLSIAETDMTGKCALIIGGEDTGIRPLVKRRCDFLCAIAQSGPVNSLNASVAGGMAVYEAMRQRRTAALKKNNAKTR